MCGILGVFNQKNDEPLQDRQFQLALEVVKHRGPDAQIFRLINANTGLGHTRLSIIDLQESSNQPFQYEHLTLTFNGEIFNYIELKKELEAAGYSFRTASDTEVIPAAYLHWGEDCVNHFNGMWAFALYDAIKDSLFCSRDRFGIKPFNYSFANNRFAFASEIKSLIAFDSATYGKPHFNAISRYCRETVGAQATETWFETVKRLPPAHNLIVTRSDYRFTRYWNYPSNTNEKLPYEDAKVEYKRLFKDAVNLRLRSDVPLGLTLSGGLDSTSIAYQVRELLPELAINAYTASFPGHRFDEYPIAKEVADQLRINSVEVQLDFSNYLETLHKIVYHLESGHGSPAIFPLWNIAERAKQDITVYLEGQGADELLGGYINSIFIDHCLDLLKHGSVNQLLLELKDHNTAWPLQQSILLYLRQTLPANLRTLYRRKEGLEKLFIGEITSHQPFTTIPPIVYNSLLKNRLIEQHTNGLVNLLHYGDAISMAHSLENRLPFTDYRLVEFAFQLKTKYKVKGALGKVIHRDTFENVLPQGIIRNKKKLGFVSPLSQVFKDRSCKTVDFLLDRDKTIPELFNRDLLENLIKSHQTGGKNHERILFKVLSTKIWLKTYQSAR